MTPDEFERLQQLFEDAIDLPEDAREPFLLHTCPDNPTLLAEVRKLLALANVPDPRLDYSLLDPLRPGVLLANRFELLQPLGKGGFGEVWSAHDRQLNEQVAIKTLRADAAARFKREVRAARKISHPNICRVHDHFEDDSLSPPVLFLSMALLPGRTLAARLRDDGPVPAAEAVEVFTTLAAALDAAHAAGIIHRDLKPANIMLTPSPVIMDFGLALDQSASSISHSLTETGAILGTRDYMAPEQFAGTPPSPATDVYALGLVLYEMLTGAQPFHGANSNESWMRRIRQGAPKLPPKPRINRRFDAVIARCLEFEPAARFQSAGEAAAALRRPAPIQIPKPALAAAAVALLAAAAYTIIPSRVPPPPPEIQRAYQDAQREVAEGAAARAVSTLRQAITAAPNFAAAHAALAEAQLELDQLFQARESIQRAVDLAPDLTRLPAPEALHIQGINRLILRQCPGAIEALSNRAAALPQADQPTALVQLARAHERCEQTREARQILQKAEQQSPRNAAVKVRAAYLASRAHEDDLAEKLLTEAESLYRERANFEGLAETLLTRGLLAAENNQLDTAEKALNSARTIAETAQSIQQQVRIRIQQSILARRRADYPAAADLAAQAATLARNNDLETLTIQGIFAAGNIHFIRSQFPEAEQSYKQALEIGTRYRDEASEARARLSLASLYSRTQQLNNVAELLPLARPYYEKTNNQRVLAQLESIENSLHFARGNFEPVFALHNRRLSAARTAAEQAEARRAIRDTSLDLGRWSDVVEVNRQIPEHSPADLLAEAEALAFLGDAASARRRYEQARPLAAGRPMLESQLAHADAVLDLLAGRFAAAERKFQALLARPALAAITRKYVQLDICISQVWGAAPARALATCRQARDGYIAMGADLHTRLATIHIAEAHLRSNNPSAAVAELTPVLPSLATLGESSEWLWRARALLARAQNPKKSLSPPDALLRYSNQSFQSRPDLKLFW